MQAGFFDYQDQVGNTFEGYIAYDEASNAKRPCVLIFHAWAGQQAFDQKNAEMLAEWGYVGFAVDMYGKGVRGNAGSDNSHLIKPFLDDRKLLLERIKLAIDEAKNHPMVDTSKIAAIGFCFGGLCVLDAARSANPDIKGVASFHGLFYPPNIGEQKSITSKVLILHGYDDPMATPEQMLGIAQELTDAKADWQIHAYGHTQHAFSYPKANAPKMGLLYNEAAAKRAWQSTENFLAGVFA